MHQHDLIVLQRCVRFLVAAHDTSSLHEVPTQQGLADIRVIIFRGGWLRIHWAPRLLQGIEKLVLDVGCLLHGSITNVIVPAPLLVHAFFNEGLVSSQHRQLVTIPMFEFLDGSVGLVCLVSGSNEDLGHI